MNEKRTALLTVCLLGAFLLTFSLWAYLKPDDAFSQSERRKLTPKPSCTAESVYSGRYMSGFETYAPDQFPLREQFRTLKSLTSLYLLRQRDTNGVYLAEGYVSRLEYPMQEDSIAHAARRFDYLYDTYLSGTNCRLYLSVIPDKNAFLASSHGYPTLDYGAFTQSLREKTPYLTYLPIGDLLSLEDYYRTDLHWRQAADGRGCPPAGGDGGRSPRHLPRGDSAHPLLRRVLRLRCPAHGAGHHPLSHQ